jgi:hypothetical protein
MECYGHKNVRFMEKDGRFRLHGRAFLPTRTGVSSEKDGRYGMQKLSFKLQRRKLKCYKKGRSRVIKIVDQASQTFQCLQFSALNIKIDKVKPLWI